MQITFFGISWLLLLTIIFFKGKTQTAIGLILFSSMFQCVNVVVLGEIGIGPFLISSLYYTVFSMFHSCKKRRDRTCEYILCSYLIFLVYILANAYVHNTLGDNGTIIVQLTIYFVCAIGLYRTREALSVDDYIAIVRKMIVFQITLAPIQLLTTKGYLPRELLNELFYNDTGEFVYFHKLGYSRILGSFMEPSYFSAFITGSFFFVLHLRDKIKHSKTILIVILVELILTTSSTGYATFVIMTILYAMFMRNRKVMLVIFPIVIGGIVFFYMMKDTLLKEVIFDKMNSNSGVERTRWNVEAMYNFSRNQMTGIGFGGCRASAFAYSLLANLGIIGTMLFTLFSSLIMYPLLVKSRKTEDNEYGSRLFFVSVLTAMVIACPDLQFCVFWFAIYLVVLSRSNNVNNLHRIVTNNGKNKE